MKLGGFGFVLQATESIVGYLCQVGSENHISLLILKPIPTTT